MAYVSGQGTNSYNVKINGAGVGSVQAVLTSACGNDTIPALSINDPGTSVNISGSSFIATGSTTSYTADVSCGGSNIEYLWSLKDVTNNLPAECMGTSYPLKLKAVSGSVSMLSNVVVPNTPIGGGSHKYLLTSCAGGTNGLGSATYDISCMLNASIVLSTSGSGGSDPLPRMVVAPNPSSDIIQVTINSSLDVNSTSRLQSTKEVVN